MTNTVQLMEQLCQDDRSSVPSDTLTIDMLERMNISETSKKELSETQQSLHQTEQDVRTVCSNTNDPANVPIRKNSQENQTCRPNENELMNRNVGGRSYLYKHLYWQWESEMP